VYYNQLFAFQFDLLPSPEDAGAHIGRSMIFYDPGVRLHFTLQRCDRTAGACSARAQLHAQVARRVGKQHDWNELEILAQGNRLQVNIASTHTI
jgi:hypothetical protein